MWRNGMIEFNGATYHWEAKVYGEPSMFGINQGRVSKLSIREPGTYREVYNYDRGLDFDKAPAGLLAAVLEAAVK